MGLVLVDRYLRREDAGDLLVVVRGRGGAADLAGGEGGHGGYLLPAGSVAHAVWRLGAPPQKLTTSARIDLTRSQTDHAAWHADGRDRPLPCCRRVYRCIGFGTDVLPARPDRAPQAHARRRGSAVGAGWSKSFGEQGGSILRESRSFWGEAAALFLDHDQRLCWSDRFFDHDPDR